MRWEDDSLKFEVTFTRDGNEFTFRYRAKLDGDGLSGAIKSKIQGEQRETPFRAKRQD